MKLTKRQITSFQQKILSWWKTHRRDLPWRHTRDPYRIMVSEVMLQQTQVLRVIAKYTEFIEAFPGVHNLAMASPADVLRIWKGMGYNRRALYLQKAARLIVEHGSPVIPANAGIQRKNVNFFDRIKFPKSEKELRKLPGLGKYTARALLVFAYEKEVALVDTNIRKIIMHYFLTKPTQGRALEKEVEDIARQLIPPGNSWDWHQALMDYGALALPALTHSPIHPSRKKSLPFRDSNRFYRGRIIDRLREGDLEENNFIKEFQKKYPKPVIFFRSIIVGLIKDGLIQRYPGSTLGLPDA